MDFDKGKAQTTEFEGKSLTPYLDHLGNITIGIGRNIDANGITEQECQMMFDHDFHSAFQEAQKNISCFLNLDEVRQYILTDMVFNMGWPRLSKFKKFLAALEKGDYDKAADEMVDSRWYHQVGRRSRKLVEMMRNGDW